MLAKLQSDKCRSYLEPGGSWGREVQLHCAERDGDYGLAIALELGKLHDFKTMCRRLKGFHAEPYRPPQGNTYPADRLKALAERVRAAATQNDPDVQRAELADIAEALEALEQPRGPVVEVTVDMPLASAHHPVTA